MDERPTRKQKPVDYRHMMDSGDVEVDDRVEVEFKGAWYPAVVEAVNDDGTFEILYDTDETESHVPAASVRKINSLTGSDDDEKPFEQPLEDEEDDEDEDEDLFVEDDKSANQPMDEEEDNDEDLAFGEEFEDQLCKKKARVKGATKPTGDIKLVLRGLDLDALREFVESVKDDEWSLQDIRNALDVADMSLQNIRDALDVVNMADPKDDDLCAAIAVLLDYEATVRELRGDDDGPSYGRGSAGARKLERQERKDELQRASDEKAKEDSTFLKKSLTEYNQDPARLASLLNDYIAKEAEKPAIEALARSGMCECAGSLGSAATWAMLTWFAAQKCREELGALLDTMDDAERSAFLLEFFRSIPKLEGEAAAAFGNVSEATLEALGAIKWPQTKEFDEAQCRQTIRRIIREGKKELDSVVVETCGIPQVDLQEKNLSEDQKFQLIVDQKRADFLSPLEKISDQLQFFNALVANPDFGLEDVFQLMSTVMFLSHDSAIGTNLHTGVMDPRAVREVRDAFLAEEAEGNIKDLEAFYAIRNRDWDDFKRVTAQKFTRKMIEGGVPSAALRARARLSIKRKNNAKTSSVSLLTGEQVIPVVVLYGAVREVKKTEETAQGVIVVAAVLDDHIYHVLCEPGDFAVTNKFTVDCALRLFGRFGPVLALKPHQRVSSVRPLKMETPGDRGFVVGRSSNPAIVAEVKSVVQKVIGQMDPILGASVAVAAASKVSNVPAHLLTARLASATPSGELSAFISTADGLPNGFGFDVAAWRDLIKSMPNIDDISKAVGPIGHILCSCPTPAPAPAPAPPPNPNTNVNGVNLGHNWTNQEHVDTGQGQG